MEPRLASSTGHLLDDPRHRGMQRLVRDLNRTLSREPALHQRDSDPTGFRWMIGDDRGNSVFAFLRFGDDDARAGAGRLQLDAGAAARLSHRRAARRAAGASCSTPMPRSMAASNMGNGGAVTTMRSTHQPWRGTVARADLAAAGAPLLLRPEHVTRHGMQHLPDRCCPARRYPLGATWDGLGINFAVFSAHATADRAVPVRPAGRHEIARYRAAGMHRRGLARLSARCTRRPALRLSRARPVRSRSTAIASTPTSCCSTPTRARWPAQLRWPDALFGYRVDTRRAPTCRSTGATARRRCRRRVVTRRRVQLGRRPRTAVAVARHRHLRSARARA